ncbi:MAG: STAS domain-containing protein [Oscillospiraceae bacterium]|nr:STAS domain-containing protein [Oscillospiraceae bacterium]
MRTTTSKLQNGELTVYIERDIDHHIAKQMRDEIDGEIQRTKPGSVKLDFEAVSFMDSAGIGLIMGRHRLTESMHIPLRLSRVNDQCRKLLDMSELPDLLEISRE